TTWQAVIETPRKEGLTDANTYREFALAMADTQLAYTNTSRSKAGTTSFSPHEPTWAEGKPAYENLDKTALPVINATACGPRVNTTVGPCPSLVSSGGTTGSVSVNYRNESISPRLTDASGKMLSTVPPLAPANDLAYAFASLMRSNPQLNAQPVPGSPINT